MNILSISSGSTTIKIKLFKMPEEEVLFSGSIKNIGSKNSNISIISNSFKEIEKIVVINTHKEGILVFYDKLSNLNIVPEEEISQISAIGHRIIHAGEKYSKSLVVDKKFLTSVKEYSEFAPLHIPPSISVIEACIEVFPKIKNIAVTDTGFFREVPEKSMLYALPYKYYKDFNIRKNNFHGIAYASMVERVEKITKKKKEQIKFIGIMLGGGSSIIANRYGMPVENSIGFTPTGGLPMSTRCGDIDPSILFFISRKKNISFKKLEEIINKESGLFGLSEKFYDFKDIEDGFKKKDPACKRAFEYYSHTIKKYIGSYIASMNGVDVISFGGGVGENSYLLRENILANLDSLGILLDSSKNKNIKGEGIISNSTSKTMICVTKIDEEKIIAKETYNLLS